MSEETATLSDEERRKLFKPNPTPKQVVEAFQTGYGKTLKIVKELDSYDDKNYLVETEDGTQYLAKVHNGVESLDYTKNDKDSCIYFQNAMMEHLNQHGIPTSAPVSVETSDNSSLSVASLPVVSGPPQDLVLRLLSWVPGRPMSSVPFLPMESLINAGRFLGKLDAKLDEMGDYTAAHRHHAWDGKNTLELRGYTKYIADERRRGMVESILNAFQHQVVDNKDVNFRTGILQADFNDANILVDDNLKVSGVIDFGDSLCSWRVLDISVAMAYSMMSAYGKNGRAISAAAAMLRGYNSVYPLQDVERKHLHLLMTCRLACSATLGAYSFQQNPENTYLLLHAEPAWKTLELVWGYDTERRMAIKAAVDGMFDKACSYGDTSDYYCCDLALPDPFIVDIMSSVREKDDILSTAKRQKMDGKPVITFVTGNKNKLQEVKRILGGDNGNGELPFAITNRKVDLPELQGDPVDIAKEKCSAAARQVGGAVITEDTSLCFTALKGLPGPYIKWFLDSLGHEGLNNLIASSEDKTAYAQTIVAFCPGPGKEVVVFDGRTMGKIVPARGSLDFGWDPIFQADEGGGLTYAEMSKEGKDAISHRSRAFSQLRDYFMNETETISSIM